MVLRLSEGERFHGRCALVEGCFDPLHDGHVAYIRAARAWLDYHRFTATPLIAIIAPDAYVARKRPPLMSETARAAVVTALDDVLHACIADTVDALRAFRPTHYIKGAAWEQRLPGEIVQTCRELGVSIKHVTTGLEHVSSGFMLQLQDRRMTAEALTRLEQFIQTQPEQKPWQPVVDYSYEARKRDEGPLPQLINQHLIRCDDADVLDWGCGHGHLIRLLQEATKGTQVRVAGYDPSHGGVPPPPQPVWDLVICREVFEHVRLRDWLALVQDIMARAAGFIYITTRFHPHPTHLLDVTLDGEREIDPTEITFATKDLLRTLFVLHGCTSRPDLEAKLDWQQRGCTLVFEV